MITEVFTPVWVKHIPTDLEPGKFYISLEYESAQHLCACGCGRRTVTPFTLEPTDNQKFWQLIKESDEVISLIGSIGNNRFPCKSHYTITANRVTFC